MKFGQLSIVIPVYNEGANFPSLWKELTSALAFPFTAWVVYDFEEDDTIPAVQAIIAAGEPRVRLLKNTIAPGVVGAIRSGFGAAPDGPVLVVMGDLSDDLQKVPQMLALYREGYDVVAGSRYMPGGQVIGGPRLKVWMSRLAGLSLHWLRRLPIHDATNAFKIYDRAMVQSFTIESTGGFELNLELTVKAFLAGRRFAEVPSTWRDRSAGTSRFRLWAWLPKYLRWYFYAFRPRNGCPRTRAAALPLLCFALFVLMLLANGRTWLYERRKPAAASSPAPIAIPSGAVAAAAIDSPESLVAQNGAHMALEGRVCVAGGPVLVDKLRFYLDGQCLEETQPEYLPGALHGAPQCAHWQVFPLVRGIADGEHRLRIYAGNQTDAAPLLERRIRVWE